MHYKIAGKQYDVVQHQLNTFPTPRYSILHQQIQQGHLLEALNLFYASRGLCSNHTDQLLHALVLAQEQEKSKNPQ